MLLCGIFTLLAVFVCRAACGEIKCQMMQFEINDRLMGHCCVFSKNVSEVETRKEEIINEILNNINETKSDATVETVSSSEKLLEETKEDETTTLPEQAKVASEEPSEQLTTEMTNKEITKTEQLNITTENRNSDHSNSSRNNEHDKVVFPEETNNENKTFFIHFGKKWFHRYSPDNSDAGKTKIIFPHHPGSFQHHQEEKKINDSKEVNITAAFLPNRNAVDTPETCPEGKKKDHTGKCVDEF